jgi:hypothetical protein
MKIQIVMMALVVLGFAHAKAGDVIQIQAATPEGFLRLIASLPRDPGPGYRGQCQFFRGPSPQSTFEVAVIKSLSTTQRSLNATVTMTGNIDSGGQFRAMGYISSYNPHVVMGGAAGDFPGIIVRGNLGKHRPIFTVSAKLLKLECQCE